MFLQRSTEFRKRFNALTIKMQDKVVVRLDMLVADEFTPILNNHELHGEYAGCRSINVTGDFRIVYRRLSKEIYLLVNLGTHPQLYE